MAPATPTEPQLLLEEAVWVVDELPDVLVLAPVAPPLPLAKPEEPLPVTVDDVVEVPPALCVAELEAWPAMAEAEANTNNAEAATPTRAVRYLVIV